ncbi:hypothetical protein [Actinacidiphila guanduensis]|uniref:Uncharacterized protein n=1 Tax=Actinacidiphila guanduensis TaxID=310781 RepID=A0A1H0DM31_9ACTN|nr:hypothetical protein [Actinacidiphila guanduensis]SDN71215.1 hypothetical protein SAMN05216259_105276 [Actinacidiphila guanduensis]
MKSATTAAADVQPPKITGRDTRAAMLKRAIRKEVPVRKEFVQTARGSASRHGPLKEFVTNGDLRALRAFLIVVACCSASNEDGWTTTHDSAVWARLLDTDVAATDQAARTGAWRTLRRLEDRGLIRCGRKRGSTRISVTLLREDGSGNDYTRPDGSTEADRFINIPIAFWLRGYDEQLDVPGLALFLAVAREKPWSPFPAEKAPEWYGWSPDTHLRGLTKLLGLGLVERRATYRKTPLSPSGFTMVYQYRLVATMRPRRKKTLPPTMSARTESRM